MALKKLSEVKVGSVVRIGGIDYTVSGNFGYDLQLVRGGLSRRASNITNVNHGTLITVISEPSSKQQELNAALAKRKGDRKANLVESLKGQINGAKALGSAVDGKARFEASIAKAGVAAVREEVREVAQGIAGLNDDVENGFEEIEEDIEDIKERLEDVEYAVEGVSEDVGDVFARLSKLESKERARDMQNNIQAQLNQKLANKKSNSNGGNKMTNLLGSFKGLFGKVEGQFAVAATGQIAMRNGLSNSYVVYDKETGTITDVQNLVLDFKVPAFRLPVEAKDVKVGNIVVNNGTYGYVTETADGFVKVTFPTKNSQGTVLPTRNLVMAKPFYTVVQTLDIAGQAGFNPALLLAMGDGKKDDILPFLLMSGGLGGQAQAGGIDPTMLMLLGDNTDELLPFLLLQQGGLTQEGFNPLMLLALSGKGGKGKDLLPLLLMGQGGAQAGGINPLMLMAMGDGELDLTTLALMGGLGGANPFGQVAAPAKAKKEDGK